MKLLPALCLALLLPAAAGAQQYLGNLSSNPHDPNSTANPYGAGSPYSPDSIHNPYGAGSPYRIDSPNNRYGRGMRVVGED